MPRAACIRGLLCTRRACLVAKRIVANISTSRASDGMTFVFRRRCRTYTPLGRCGNFADARRTRCCAAPLCLRTAGISLQRLRATLHAHRSCLSCHRGCYPLATPRLPPCRLLAPTPTPHLPRRLPHHPPPACLSAQPLPTALNRFWFAFSQRALPNIRCSYFQQLR